MKCFQCGKILKISQENDSNIAFCSEECSWNNTIQIGENMKEAYDKDISPPKVDGKGMRHNEGKIPLDMVPESINEAIAKVLQKGFEKYEKNNWRRGMSFETVYGCLQRHLQKWHHPRKSDIDEETQLNHLYLAACNIAFLIEYLETCPDQDDRYKQ